MLKNYSKKNIFQSQDTQEHNAVSPEISRGIKPGSKLWQDLYKGKPGLNKIEQKNSNKDRITVEEIASSLQFFKCQTELIQQGLEQEISQLRDLRYNIAKDAIKANNNIKTLNKIKLIFDEANETISSATSEFDKALADIKNRQSELRNLGKSIISQREESIKEDIEMIEQKYIITSKKFELLLFDGFVKYREYITTKNLDTTQLTIDRHTLLEETPTIVEAFQKRRKEHPKLDLSTQDLVQGQKIFSHYATDFDQQIQETNPQTNAERLKDLKSRHQKALDLSGLFGQAVSICSQRDQGATGETLPDLQKELVKVFDQITDKVSGLKGGGKRKAADYSLTIEFTNEGKNKEKYVLKTDITAKDAAKEIKNQFDVDMSITQINNIWLGRSTKDRNRQWELVDIPNKHKEKISKELLKSNVYYEKNLKNNQNHKKQIRKQQHQYYQGHKEQIRKQQRQYYQDHKVIFSLKRSLNYIIVQILELVANLENLNKEQEIEKCKQKIDRHSAKRDKLLSQLAEAQKQQAKIPQQDTEVPDSTQNIASETIEATDTTDVLNTPRQGPRTFKEALDFMYTSEELQNCLEEIANDLQQLAEGQHNQLKGTEAPLYYEEQYPEDLAWEDDSHEHQTSTSVEYPNPLNHPQHSEALAGASDTVTPYASQHETSQRLFEKVSPTIQTSQDNSSPTSIFQTYSQKNTFNTPFPETYQGPKDSEVSTFQTSSQGPYNSSAPENTIPTVETSKSGLYQPQASYDQSNIWNHPDIQDLLSGLMKKMQEEEAEEE